MTTLKSMTIQSPTSPGRRWTRWGLASLGVMCVGLGAIGAVVPGMPTTIFLIIASFCFARSCPWLEQRLIRNRFFAPYVRYLDRTTPMPRRAKLTTIAIMWACVSVSFLALHVRGGLSLPLMLVVAAAALLGTFFVLRWSANPRTTRRGGVGEGGTVGEGRSSCPFLDAASGD